MLSKQRKRTIVDNVRIRLNRMIEIRTVYEQWLKDTNQGLDNTDAIADEINKMMGTDTMKMAIDFNASGMTAEFETSREKAFEMLVRDIEKDTQKKLQGITKTIEATLQSDEYIGLSDPELKSEFARQFGKLAKPIFIGQQNKIDEFTENFDRAVELQTLFHEWIGNATGQSLIPEQALRRIESAIGGKGIESAQQLNLEGFTDEYESAKQEVLDKILRSFDEDTRDAINKKADSIYEIISQDKDFGTMSNAEIMIRWQEIYEQQKHLITSARDIHRNRIMDEFEDMEQLQMDYYKWLQENYGQSFQNNQTQDAIDTMADKSAKSSGISKQVKKISEEVFKSTPTEVFRKIQKPEDTDDVINGVVLYREKIFKAMTDNDELNYEVEKEVARQEAVIEKKKQTALHKMRLGAYSAIAPKVKGIDDESEKETIYQTHLQEKEQSISKRFDAQKEGLKPEIMSRIGDEVYEIGQGKYGSFNDEINKPENQKSKIDERASDKEKYDMEIEDAAVSAAKNILQGWQQVSAQTDTMVDDVVGAVGIIAVNLTEMILSIQRAGALQSAANSLQAAGGLAAGAAGAVEGSGGLLASLGPFAKYAGIAGLGLTAAATIYSFIDNHNESKNKRNSISGRRPNSLARR